MDPCSEGDTKNLHAVVLRDPRDLYVLGVVDNNLVLYNDCRLQGDIIAKNLRSDPFTACSISDLIQNRYIFLVGGLTDDGKLPSSDVFFYDLENYFCQDPSCRRTPGPPLIGSKWCPTLIVMGTKLFAISHILCDPNPNSVWESQPPYEVLDTASGPPDSWEWWTGESFPTLPPASDDGDSYHLVSYAADECSDTLYLCLGDGTIPHTQGALCIAYNTCLDKWFTGVHQPLPFDGEVKVFNDLFFGFPCGTSARDCSSYLAVYRLDTSPNLKSTSCSSCWVMLHKYALFLGISKPYRAYFLHLSFLSKDIVATIRATSSLDCEEPRVLDFDLVRLCNMRLKKEQDDQDGDIEAPLEIIIRKSWCRQTEEFDAILGVRFPHGGMPAYCIRNEMC